MGAAPSNRAAQESHPSLLLSVCAVSHQLEHEVLLRAVQGSGLSPSPGQPGCLLPGFLPGEESWEQRMSEDREGPCGGRSQRRAVPFSPFRRSRPEHPPGHPPEALCGVFTQPAPPRSAGPPGSGWGQRDTSLPDQAREPLTSTHRYNHTGTQFFEIKKSRPLTG